MVQIIAEAKSKGFRASGLLRKGGKKMTYKVMKEITKGAAKGAMGDSILAEIGLVNHGSKWKFSYYDEKFNLISTNMALIEDEIQTIAAYINKYLEKEVQNVQGKLLHGKTRAIAISTVSFLLIAILIAAAIYLFIKTKSSHWRKRMEGLLKIVGNLKTDYKSKVHLLTARKELNNIEERDQRMQRQMRQIQGRRPNEPEVIDNSDSEC